MTNHRNPAMPSRLTLWAETAADVMMPNPHSIREDATLKEAVAFLSDKGFSAAPVINEAGHPIGVLSRADIVVHDREQVSYATKASEYSEPAAPRAARPLPEGFQEEIVDRTLVRDIMTPVVFSVAPSTPIERVLSEMLGMKVHRLFVVDDAGVLVGVISTFDLLRHLGTAPPTGLRREIAAVANRG